MDSSAVSDFLATAKLFLIGFVGSLITAGRFMPGEGIFAKIFHTVAGAISAYLLTPAVVEYMKMGSPSYENAIAFLIGLLGVSFISATLQAIKETQLAKLLTDALRRVFGLGAEK